MTQGGNYPFISATHHFPWSTATGGAPAASTVVWYSNASTAAAVSSSLLTPGTTTTGWTAPASAPTTYFGGAGGPVMTTLAGNTTGKWYFSQGSNESWAGYRYIQVDIARMAGGPAPVTWRSFEHKYLFFASSASDGSVRHTEIEIPIFRDSAFHTLSFRLTNSSEIYTWGIISAGTATGSSGDIFSIRNAYKRAMNEIETAFEQSTNNTVLVPTGFTQTGEVHRIDLTSNQTLIDLRSSVSMIRVEARDRRPMSPYIDLTGTSHAVDDVAQFFMTLRNECDVYFPPNSSIKSTAFNSLYWPGLKQVRFFGNRSNLFYHSATPFTTYRDTGLMHLGYQWRIDNSHHDVLVKDFLFTGIPTTTTYDGGDSSALTTLSGSKTTAAGLHKIGPTSGHEIRTPYDVSARYPMGADSGFTTNWQYRFDFVLSVDAGTTNDCVIAIKDDLGTVYAQSTVTLTAVASTHILVADAATADLGYRIAGTVKKGTAGASTINIHSIKRWGHMTTDLTYEAQHGAFVYSNWETTAESSRVMSNVVLDSIHTEGFGGDGIILAQFNTGPMHTRVVNSTSRANARQQIAVVGGEHIDILNNVIREYGQTGLDIEPLGSDHVSHIRVEQNRFMHGLNDTYNAISAANPRVINASIQNNVMMSRKGNFLNFGGLNSIIANNQQHHYSTHSTAYNYSNAGNPVLNLISGAVDNFITGNRMMGGYSAAGTRNVFVANRAVTSGESGSAGQGIFQDVGTDNQWFWNVQIGSTAVGGATYWGQVNISSATRPVIMGMGIIGQSQAADTFKGMPFISSPWFVNGLDLLREPLKQVRGISGSTVKMNQFVMTVTPGANTTSATVTFSSREAGSLPTASTVFSTTESVTSAATAALWTNTSVYYRIAPHNYYGPGSAQTTINVTLANTTSVARIRVGGLVNTSRFINGFRIYRGEENGTTTAYYDVLPNGNYKEFAMLRQDTFSFYDLGNNGLYVPPIALNDPSSPLNWGYSTLYPLITGTSAAFTSMPAADYSGRMQSTTYSVIPGTPTFNAGTIYITSAGKTSMGFTINWTGATAASTDTIPLLFVSS